MDLDINRPCPGGTGKKIKFCCKDLTRDLDKIVRLLEGGQRKAAVDAIDRTLATAGDRACLYALKIEALGEGGESEQTRDTMQAFAQKFPDNPIALADGAMVAAADRRLEDAVDRLQQALALSGDSIDPNVYGAYGVVAQGLLEDGNLPAARAHLMMQADMSRGSDRQPFELLGMIDGLPQCNVIFKYGLDLETQAPAGSAWQAELTQIDEMSRHGEWKRALAAMRALGEKHPHSELLLKNVALLASRLGNKEATVQAWRAFAAAPSAVWDDRVEAEAFAQLLEPPRPEDAIDEVKVTYAIRDLDRLTETLLSAPQAISFGGDLRELVEENETPPKCAFQLLDRPANPAPGEGLEDRLPANVGVITVYGKRTDRDARLEYEILRDERCETSKQILADVAGESLGPAESEEVIGQTTRTAAEMAWRWHFPADTPHEVRQELLGKKQRVQITVRWPDIPLGVLGGRSPREAARESALRVPVAAAVLLIELSVGRAKWGGDINRLRTELGLPADEPLDPQELDMRSLPLVRMPRLVVEKLSDKDVLIAFRRAAMYHYVEAIIPLAREGLRRDLGGETFDRAAAHRILAHSAASMPETLEHLKKAQDILVKRGESPAQLLLEEFRLRLATGVEMEKCDAILQRLRTNHMQEPGIAQGIYQIFVRMGLISPDGRPIGPAGSPEEASGGAPVAQTSKLWTPEAAAPAKGEKKSALWTPEFD